MFFCRLFGSCLLLVILVWLEVNFRKNKKNKRVILKSVMVVYGWIFKLCRKIYLISFMVFVICILKIKWLMNKYVFLLMLGY